VETRRLWETSKWVDFPKTVVFGKSIGFDEATRHIISIDRGWKWGRFFLWRQAIALAQISGNAKQAFRPLPVSICLVYRPINYFIADDYLLLQS
jgi:hypothetical protein